MCICTHISHTKHAQSVSSLYICFQAAVLYIEIENLYQDLKTEI